MSEDYGIYVKAECAEKEDTYVEASIVGRKEYPGTYMNKRCVKYEDVYVNVSVAGENKTFDRI